MEWQQSITSSMPQGKLRRALFNVSNQTFQLSKKTISKQEQITNHRQQNQIQSGKVDHLTKNSKT